MQSDSYGDLDKQTKMNQVNTQLTTLSLKSMRGKLILPSPWLPSVTAQS
jgi:hypothetical protein